MFEKTYYGTHPDMMECVSNDELRDRVSTKIIDMLTSNWCSITLLPADVRTLGDGTFRIRTRKH
jgi:4-deoxy-L-threo-5-hexosulose-uronate ketol-isomerase